MKGLWNEYSGAPYNQPPVKCINTLQITTVADSTFTGLQIIAFAADTSIKEIYNCKGVVTKINVQFYRGDLVYKKNSSRTGYGWNECPLCTARTCSLYVANNKIILQLTTKSSNDTCSGTIAYYRELSNFDSTTQQQITLLYSRPRYSSLTAFSTSTSPSETDVAAPEANKTAKADSSSPLANDVIVPLVLKERTNKLAQTLQITSPYIEVILLDDAEIDGDIVSLYHNNEEVIDHKTLGKEVIKYRFKADQQHAHHEIILVAENLGSIPPNTGLMRIRAGDKKYELTTRANMHENAKVVIEYTGSE